MPREIVLMNDLEASWMFLLPSALGETSFGMLGMNYEPELLWLASKLTSYSCNSRLWHGYHRPGLQIDFFSVGKVDERIVVTSLWAGLFIC